MRKGRNKPPDRRQSRVAEEIRSVLAWTLERGDVRDQAIAQSPPTITAVRVSPDLRHARVYFTPLGGGDARALHESFQRVSPFLRHELARKLKLRYVPALSFEVDASFDEADAMTALFRRPEVRRDLEDPLPEAGCAETKNGGGDGA